MTTSSTPRTAVVIPNWNGKDDLPGCLDSLLKQSLKAEIIVVENGSTDGSLELLATQYPGVTVLPQEKNLGFAGGVNVGIRYALEQNFIYVALFNNDAVADKSWLKELVRVLEQHSEVGIATCNFMAQDKSHQDSTGDTYTIWGLPYPRGRGEPVSKKYDDQQEIFGASGGASIYRSEMLKEIGLFDEDFFAYYEDVDISFRAQLAGWKIRYVPTAIAYHQIGGTSSKIKGFTTYQAMKNLPLALYKNVPQRYLFTVGWRFFIAYNSFFVSAVARGQGWPALKGGFMAAYLLFKKHSERRRIQSTKKVSDEYIWSIMVHDLPPNATKLRRLRAKWWKLRGKKT